MANGTVSFEKFCPLLFILGSAALPQSTTSALSDVTLSIGKLKRLTKQVPVTRMRIMAQSRAKLRDRLTMRSASLSIIKRGFSIKHQKPVFASLSSPKLRKLLLSFRI
jgi:hypothetical protein